MLRLLVVFTLSLFATVALAGEDAMVLATEGGELAGKGDLTGARQKLERAYVLAPKNAAILFNLAQVREAAGDMAAALAGYGEYLKLAPNAPDAGDVKSRIARLQAAATNVPAEAEMKLLKGQKLFKAERYDDAVSAFLEAEKLAPSWAAPQFNLGVTYEQMGKLGEAKTRFDRYRPLATPDEQKALDDRLVDLEIKVDDQKKAQTQQKKVETEAGAVVRIEQNRIEPKSGLEFVHMPAGTFHFGCEPGDSQCDGDEKPGKDVAVKAFWIGKTEVPVVAFEKCVKAGACTEPDTSGWTNNCTYPEKPNHPVNCIDYNFAAQFCAWIGGRLPTAEDWEFAAKSGEGRIYPWGNTAANTTVAQYHASSGKTAPVGTHPGGANKWGVLDMAGNVWEWTASNHDASYIEIRGGSWYDDASDLRASNRNSYPPSWRYNDVGFRCGL